MARGIIEHLKAPVKFEHVGSERDFEETVMEHIKEICEFLSLPEIQSVHRQEQLRFEGIQIIFDIVVRHVDKTATIFEVKKYSNKDPHTGTSNQMSAIGQTLLYQNLFEARTGGKPRLVIIDNKIYYRTYLAFLGNNLPIALVEFQKDRVFIPYKPF